MLVDGRSISVYSNSAESPKPLGSDFESVVDSLAAFERTQVELDGSFVHRTTDGCQIDGMIYDHRGVIQYVELSGESDRLTWRRIIEALSHEIMRITLQDLAFGVMTSSGAYEDWLWSDGN